MKWTNITAGLFALLSVSLVACDKDDTNDDNFTSRHTLQQGTWRVESYTDNGTDRTADYSAYTFTFRDTGLLTVESAITQLRASWNARQVEGEERLMMRFPGAPAPFNELSEEWRIIEKTDIRVRMEDISSGGADKLTFARNS